MVTDKLEKKSWLGSLGSEYWSWLCHWLSWSWTWWHRESAHLSRNLRVYTPQGGAILCPSPLPLPSLLATSNPGRHYDRVRAHMHIMGLSQSKMICSEAACLWFGLIIACQGKLSVPHPHKAARTGLWEVCVSISNPSLHSWVKFSHMDNFYHN